MKASIQTRVFMALTVDEAREAANRPTDLQLAIRDALYQIDGMPISMMAPKPALLAAPKNGHKKAKRVTKRTSKRTNRIHAPDKQCPHCGEMKKAMGYYRHVIACKAKHPDAPLPGEQYLNFPNER